MSNIVLYLISSLLIHNFNPIAPSSYADLVVFLNQDNIMLSIVTPSFAGNFIETLCSCFPQVLDVILSELG